MTRSGPSGSPGRAIRRLAAALALALSIGQAAPAQRSAPARHTAPTTTTSTPAAPSTSQPTAAASAKPVAVYLARIVHRYPHDRGAFTEGLLWHDGALYESTGKEGASDVRRVTLVTGKVEKRAPIPAAQFGEGLAYTGGEFVSLTWHEGIAHRWRASTLAPVGENRYQGEGWGMTSDGTSLIQSDGSATLVWRDPRTLAVTRRLAVTLGGKPVDQLNELEWIDGRIFANVWHLPYLIRIDPASGAIDGIIDCRALVAEVNPSDPDQTLNGIAWDAAKRRLFVTGKLWPTLFEIALVPRGATP